MRLRLLTTAPLALVATLVPTLVAPTAADAALPSCAATATPPHPEPTRPGLHASGTFACAVQSFNLFVTVCVEELAPDLSWSALGCSSTVLNDGGGWVTADVTVAAPQETAVLRASVWGTNERGDTASGTSAPVVWPRCGCP